jgi:hypothetical protein
MMELLLTQHCFITITYLNSLAKNKPKKKFNKQLAFEIFDRYLLCEELIRKGDSITAFLVEHNDVLYKVIKPIPQATKDLIRRIFTSLQYSLQRDSDIILAHEINMLINNNPAFQSITLTDGESN